MYHGIRRFTKRFFMMVDASDGCLFIGPHQLMWTNQWTISIFNIVPINLNSHRIHHVVMNARSGKPSLSESKMMQSLRTGHHATVYEVRRDPDLKNKDVIRDRNKPVFPFIGGSQYKGQWNADQKEGFGIQVNPDNTKYEGEWGRNKYNGRGTLWVKKGKEYIRQYVGDWQDGKMEGQGIFYYEKGEIYRGEWLNGERCGNGRYEWSNGDVYNGEWKFNKHHGLGTMSYSNGNLYEGLFVDGKKEGPGLFYYASTKKIYQGEWTDDQPRCGEFRSPTQAEELKFVRPLPKGIFHNNFSMPELGLATPNEVIELAVSSTRMESLEKTWSRPHTPFLSIIPDDLERAKVKFHDIAGSSDAIPVHFISEVIREMGIYIENEDVEELERQLGDKDLTFADISEIASFIQAEYTSRTLRK